MSAGVVGGERRLDGGAGCDGPEGQEDAYVAESRDEEMMSHFDVCSISRWTCGV